jgi:hypothetical protein
MKRMGHAGMSSYFCKRGGLYKLVASHRGADNGHVVRSRVHFPLIRLARWLAGRFKREGIFHRVYRDAF